MNLDKNRLRGATPSLWYITNGQAIVGPVETELLLRGITSARIPGDCMVTQDTWRAWRGLDEIRETAIVRRKPMWLETDDAQERQVARGLTEDLVQRAPDAGEALLFAMHAAVAATGATAALVHRLREPFVGLVTSSAHGVVAEGRLGEIIPRTDSALLAAREGRAILGLAGGGGEPEKAIARRFFDSDAACATAGVAMAPIFDGGHLLAMIELARVDHPFRACDADSLEQLARIVCLK